MSAERATKHRVAIVGGGVVGAAIAYELSAVPALDVVLLDRDRPAAGSTGAALGILVGISSQKLQGRAWELRDASLRRYATLLPELTAAGHPVPVNRQGILSLCRDASELPTWERVIARRREQGWTLEQWEVERVRERCPHLNATGAIAGIYSPQDCQIDPRALTSALIAAAEQRGASCHFNTTVLGAESAIGHCRALQTTAGDIPVDRLVIAAGLGSLPLTAGLDRPVALRPVLGQAARVRVPHPLGRADFQPVITVEDVHLVPLGNCEYWVGATVEFPDEAGAVVADRDRWEAVWQSAIASWPALAAAEILETWSGQRPRPDGQAAPVIGPLSGYDNVFLATGHYRNGVLLAPATALAVRAAIAP